MFDDVLQQPTLNPVKTVSSVLDSEDVNGGMPNQEVDSTNKAAEKNGNNNVVPANAAANNNSNQMFGGFNGQLMQSQSEQQLASATANQNNNYQQMVATGQGFFGGLRGDEDYQLQVALMRSQEEALQQ